MPYDLEAVRKALKEQMGGRGAPDPTEFKVPKAKAGEELKFRFFIMPPYTLGDQLVTGPASQTMRSYYLPSGAHWFNQKPTPCPRVLTCNDPDYPCPVCDIGFELLREAKAQRKPDEERQALRDQWMPTTGDTVNIYFPDDPVNPEEYRRQVRWWKSPPTVSKMWYAASMLDDPGKDPLAPLAFGAFFDEMSAFLFELKCKLAGNNNEYKTSGFLTRGLSGELFRGPIALLPDRTPDLQTIKHIMASRHDLHSKIEKPDVRKVKKLADRMMGVVHGEFDVDEQTAHQQATNAATGVRPAGSTATTNVATGYMASPAPAHPAVTDVAPGYMASQSVVGEAPLAAPAPAQAAPAQAATAQAAPAPTAAAQAANMAAVDSAADAANDPEVQDLLAELQRRTGQAYTKTS